MGEADGENNFKDFDPGWNDPPMFSYDSRPLPAPGKKLSLTKRVGLSWDSSVPAPAPLGTTLDGHILPASAPPRGPAVGPPPLGGPPVTTSDTVLPPAPVTLPSPPLPSAPPCEEEPTPQSTEALSDSASGFNLESVSSSLNEVAEQLFIDKERERTEIVKRLSLLESLWREGKFPDDVKEKLLSISTALKNGDAEEADKLQRGLMVDHSGVCSAWMAAVRKMISTLRQTPAS